MEIQNPGIMLTGCRTLVIEDDPTLRELMISILEELGAKCVEFSNAEDALVHLLEKHGQCDLVIADHGVPGSIKGMELAQMVNQKWPGLPILMMSGSALDTECLTAPSIFLYKPWSMENFIAALLYLLPERSGAAPSNNTHSG